MKYQYCDYKIKVIKDKGFYPIDNNGKKNEYQKPCTIKNHPKIYIFTKNNEAYYIGYTTQPLSSRFRVAIDAAINTKNSYKGYQWIKEEAILKLHVFCFEESVEANTRHSKMFENMESEIVYLYKKKFDKWPTFQSEIHFYERIGSTKNVKIWASRIFKEIFK